MGNDDNNPIGSQSGDDDLDFSRLDLDKLAAQIALGDPGNQEILKSYYLADSEGIYQALNSSLHGKSARLDSIIEKVRRQQDPLGQLMELEATIAPLKSQYDKIGPMLDIISLLDPSEVPPEIMSLRKIYDQLTVVVGSIDKLTNRTYDLEYKAICSIKSMSVERELSPAELVQSMEYRDEIARHVIPTRDEAEQHFWQTNLLLDEVYGILDLVIELGNSLGGVPDEASPSHDTVPTKEEMELFRRTALAYTRKEWDRIYPAG
jgi:hypothetical protein